MNEPKLEMNEHGCSPAEWNDRLRRAAKILDVLVKELADTFLRKHLNKGMVERTAVELVDVFGATIGYELSTSFHAAGKTIGRRPTECKRAVRILVPVDGSET